MTAKPPKIREVGGQKNVWETRIRFGGGRRKRFIIRHCKNAEAALERAAALTEMADALVAAGKANEVPLIIERAARAETTAKFQVVRNLVRRLCSGAYDQNQTVVPSQVPSDITLRAFAAMWTDGELHRVWPDHVPPKRSAQDDLWRIEKYITPVIGHVAVAELTLEDAETVMRLLDRKLSAASRRHVAQILVRLCHLAVFPARLRAATPLPRGWLPKLKKRKAYPILFPSEDAALLGATDVPVLRRMLYGFLHREGVRRGDAETLHWRQLDLVHDTIKLEEDKTDHPRMWRLDAGVAEALRRW